MSYQSAREVFEDLENRFDSDAAEALEAVFQFHVTDSSGEDPAKWVVHIDNGSVNVWEGEHDEPTVTLSLTEDTWVDLGKGEKGAISAFMSGEIKASGNVMLAQKLGPVFGFSL